MFYFDDGYSENVMDQDSAVLQALARTDKGLFDVDEAKDEDLDALYER